MARGGGALLSPSIQRASFGATAALAAFGLWLGCAPSSAQYDSLCTTTASRTLIDHCRLELAGSPSVHGDCLNNLPPDAGRTVSNDQFDAYGVAVCKASHAGQLLDCLATNATMCNPDGGPSSAAAETSLLLLCFTDAGIQDPGCTQDCGAKQVTCSQACRATTAKGCWDCFAKCGLDYVDCANACPVY